MLYEIKPIFLSVKISWRYVNDEFQYKLGLWIKYRQAHIKQLPIHHHPPEIYVLRITVNKAFVNEVII